MTPTSPASTSSTVAVHKHQHTASWGRDGSPHAGPVLCHVMTRGWTPRDYLFWFSSLVESQKRTRGSKWFRLMEVRSAWSDPRRAA